MGTLFAIGNRVAVATLCCLLIGIIAGCGGPRRDVLGKWRPANDPTGVQWEFAEGGALSIGKTRARYSFGDRERMKVETGSSTAIYQVEVAEDRLLLTDPTGSKLNFVRVK
jgi:hypothetical protein